jgi:hypothetical protein
VGKPPVADSLQIVWFGRYQDTRRSGRVWTLRRSVHQRCWHTSAAEGRIQGDCASRLSLLPPLSSLLSFYYLLFFSSLLPPLSSLLSPPSSLLPPPSSLLAFYLSLFLCLHKRHFNPGAPLTLNCLQVASFTVLPSGSCSMDSLIAATEKNDERKKWLSGAKPDGAPAAAAVAAAHVATMAGKRVEALRSNAGRSGGGGKLWIEGVHRGVIWLAEQVSRKVSVS